VAVHRHREVYRFAAEVEQKIRKPTVSAIPNRHSSSPYRLSQPHPPLTLFSFIFLEKNQNRIFISGANTKCQRCGELSSFFAFRPIFVSFFAALGETDSKYKFRFARASAGHRSVIL
jgi:hypothetical protein